MKLYRSHSLKITKDAEGNNWIWLTTPSGISAGFNVKQRQDGSIPGDVLGSFTEVEEWVLIPRSTYERQQKEATERSQRDPWRPGRDDEIPRFGPGA